MAKKDEGKIMDRAQQLKTLVLLSKEIRGSLLDLAIINEGVLSDIISRHFCPDEDRRALLFSLVLNTGDLSFVSKTKIFNNLLKLYYPHLIEKYPKVIKELDNLRKFRNKLVHSLLDTSPGFLGKQSIDSIRLIHFKGGQGKRFVVTINDRDKKDKEWRKLFQTLLNIQREISEQLGLRESI